MLRKLFAAGKVFHASRYPEETRIQGDQARTETKGTIASGNPPAAADLAVPKTQPIPQPSAEPNLVRLGIQQSVNSDPQIVSNPKIFGS